MTYIFSVVIILFSSLTPLWASTLETKTHFYLLDEHVKGILAVDRKTNAEKVIPLAQVPCWMVIHDDFGYVFSSKKDKNLFVINLKTNEGVKTIKISDLVDTICFYNSTGYLLSNLSSSVFVIDLKTYELLPAIPVGRSPTKLFIHNAMGYTVNFISQDVSVINLNTNQVTHTIHVGGGPNHIIIHEDQGYVANLHASSVSVIDLKTNTVTHKIPVGEFPRISQIWKNIGYVVNDPDTISVIDLKTNTVTQTIPVGEKPTSIRIHGDKGYITYLKSSIISVLDLKTNTITHTIPIGIHDAHISIHGHVGYVNSYLHNTINVIDLTTNTVISNLNKPLCKKLNFTGTHVYLGHDKVCPHFITKGDVQDHIVNKKLGMPLKTTPFLGTLSLVEPLDAPDAPTFLDDLPLDEALESLKPWENDGEAYLVFLKMLQSPKRITGSAPWNNHIRYGIYATFFQALRVNNQRNAQEILTGLIQVGDMTLPSLFPHAGQMDADTLDGTTDALTDKIIPAKKPTPKPKGKKAKKGKKGKKTKKK